VSTIGRYVTLILSVPWGSENRTSLAFELLMFSVTGHLITRHLITRLNVPAYNKWSFLVTICFSHLKTGQIVRFSNNSNKKSAKMVPTIQKLDNLSWNQMYPDFGCLLFRSPLYLKGFIGFREYSGIRLVELFKFFNKDKLLSEFHKVLWVSHSINLFTCLDALHQNTLGLLWQCK
jgi:hypothetical protein